MAEQQDARKTAGEAAPSSEADEKGEKPAPKDFESRFPIVGIGASAGGVKALETFFRNMRADCGMAFIVIQHLSTEHESHMRSLLTKYTDMQVFDTEEGMTVEPNRVYLNPPGIELVVRDRTLYTRKASRERGMAVPIDVLFRSLAEELKEYAICIVLTGANADGTQGAKAVKGQGGLVVAQDPDEASHPRMPNSVIEAGMADLVLPVDQIPDEILRYAGHPFIQSLKNQHAEETEETEENYQKQIQPILTLVRKKTGHDFSEYKHNTIRRRIQRRMALNHIQKITDYRRFIRQDPDEAEELFRDLTITVTDFFRDPEAFARLKEKVLKPLMEQTEENGNLRAWVPGCATGEEAFSLAMVLLETMEDLDRYIEVKVFASDINDDAIRAARTGIYSRGIAANLSDEQLKRFFTKKNDHYQVDSKIRDMVVFADHNLLRDPPFSNMDLVSCRNLLIYMESALQKKIFPVLHYAIKPGGYLFLGTSESIGENSGFFKPVDKKYKIFRREEQPPADLPQVQHPQPPRTGKRKRRSDFYNPEDDREKQYRPNIRAMFEEAITKKYAQSAVLIDGNDTVRYFYGNTDRYLSFPRGEADFNIFKMASGQLHYKLSQTIGEARKGKESIKTENIPIRQDGAYLEVNISFSRVNGAEGRQNWILIEFEENERAGPSDSEPVGTEGETAASEEKAELEKKLHHTQQELQATIEELETSNEELKSSNEELQANNEELQSTNEELESSKEELQSTNEELETVNSELYQKNEELEKAESDMKNLFSAVENAIILLNDDLCIKRFTPSATKIFHLKDVDVGRRFSDISSKLEYDHLEKDVEEVLDRLERKESTVKSRDGKFYQMRIIPYRTGKNVIEGVVLSFFDITHFTQAEQQKRDAGSLLKETISALWEPILLLKESLDIIRANPSFYEMFRTSAEETLDQKIFQLGDNQWDIPELRTLMEEIIPKENEFKGYVVEHDFPRIGRRRMALSGRKIHSGEDRPPFILMGFKDITDQNGQ